MTDLSDLGGDAGASDASLDAAGDAGACTGPDFACVPAVPSGWSGPFWTYYGDPSALPTGCPSAAPNVAISGNEALLDASVSCSGQVCSARCGSPFPLLGLSLCGAPLEQPTVTGLDAVTASKADAAWSVALQNAYVSGCDFVADVVDAGATWKASMLGCTPDAATPLTCRRASSASRRRRSRSSPSRASTSSAPANVRARPIRSCGRRRSTRARSRRAT